MCKWFAAGIATTVALIIMCAILDISFSMRDIDAILAEYTQCHAR